MNQHKKQIAKKNITTQSTTSKKENFLLKGKKDWNCDI